jgi:hypothetical protein
LPPAATLLKVGFGATVRARATIARWPNRADSGPSAFAPERGDSTPWRTVSVRLSVSGLAQAAAGGVEQLPRLIACHLARHALPACCID